MWNLSCFLISRRFVPILAMLLLLTSLILRPAAAEPLKTIEQTEEAALRQELERIVKEENPERADAARKTLEALDKPKTSREGRRLRSRRERGDRRIVNGQVAFRYSPVAAILRGNDPNRATAWCTGTLIGCNKILTAAHCIQKDPTPANYLVYFPNLGFVKLSDIDWPKDEYSFPYADLAILTLAKPVEGIAPISINRRASPINGKIALIVGYGRTGGTRRDYGIKRDGSIKFGMCQPRFSDKKLLCWNFDADIPGETNTCQADSGGGVFYVDKEGARPVQRVVGIVSGGTGSECLKEQSYNTDVFHWRDWITKAAREGLSDETCGASARIDAPENLKGELVMLGAAQPETTIEFDVPVGTASLRVAMNGEDTAQGDNDFDLFVFEGLAKATNEPACAQTGTGQFAFCEIRNPHTGQWTISLRRKRGEGLAQVSVTLVPSLESQ